jgi:hypothetical protein
MFDWQFDNQELEELCAVLRVARNVPEGHHVSAAILLGSGRIAVAVATLY